mgnify:CR=1 FL=1
MSSTDATFFKLNFKPGFHRESTRYAEEGKWFDGDHVRFREGRPENIRGYSKKSSTQYVGTARDLLVWAANDTQKLMSWATEHLWYLLHDDLQYDITPVVSTGALANDISITNGSTKITVSVASHNRDVGDYVFFTSTDAISGGIINLNTDTTIYSVLSVVDANVFTVSSGVTADATGTSVGGTGTVHFLLETGISVATPGLGFGAGVYNAGTSANGARAWNRPATESNITFALTTWSMDNWGEDVVACRRGSQIFYLDVNASVTPERAVVISASPAENNHILVSPNDRHLISLGCTGFASPYSPLRVRWADTEDYTNWTPSVSSTAGEVDLISGTEIVTAVRSRNQINILTDKSLYGMTFIGGNDVFSFRQLGTNCGAIGPHAAVDYDGTPMWMSQNNFYMFDGQVKNLKATIRRHLFDSFNMAQKDKVYAGVNSEFKEVIWLFPSSSGTECDSYAIFNPEENTWVYGTSKWTTFKDRTVYDNTITTGSDGFIYDNEPTNVYTGDNLAIPSFVESADLDLEDGMDIMFVDKIIPDFTINDGTLQFTLSTKKYPNGPLTTKGPYSITANTEKINLRARGRQARVKVSSASSGIGWKWGAVRAGAQKDGKN